MPIVYKVHLARVFCAHLPDKIYYASAWHGFCSEEVVLISFPYLKVKQRARNWFRVKQAQGSVTNRFAPNRLLLIFIRYQIPAEICAQTVSLILDRHGTIVNKNRAPSEIFLEAGDVCFYSYMLR